MPDSSGLVRLDLERGVAWLGATAISVASAGSNGELRVGGDDGTVLRPLSFGERSDATAMAELAPTAIVTLARLIRAAATVHDTATDPTVAEILALYLAGAGSTTLSFEEVERLMTVDFGWDRETLTRERAIEVDRFATAVSKGDESSEWNRLLILGDGTDSVALASIRADLAENLLERAGTRSENRGRATREDGELGSTRMGAALGVESGSEEPRFTSRCAESSGGSQLASPSQTSDEIATRPLDSPMRPAKLGLRAGRVTSKRTGVAATGLESGHVRSLPAEPVTSLKGAANSPPTGTIVSSTVNSTRPSAKLTGRFPRHCSTAPRERRTLRDGSPAPAFPPGGESRIPMPELSGPLTNQAESSPLELSLPWPVTGSPPFLDGASDLLEIAGALAAALDDESDLRGIQR